MKITDLFEIKDISKLEDTYATQLKYFQNNMDMLEYIADMDLYKILKYQTTYVISDKDKLVALFNVVDGNNLDNAYVIQDYRGQSLFSKFVWYLLSREKIEKVWLGDRHSDDMKNQLIKMYNRFGIYWYNKETGESIEFNPSEVQNFYVSDLDKDNDPWLIYASGKITETYVKKYPLPMPLLKDWYEGYFGTVKERALLYEESEIYGYHVTLRDNSSSIRENGLIPQIGDRSKKIEDEIGVYIFKNYTALEDAVMNWLGDEFGEDAKLIVLEVNYQGLNYRVDPSMPDVVIVKELIVPKRIYETDIKI